MKTLNTIFAIMSMRRSILVSVFVLIIAKHCDAYFCYKQFCKCMPYRNKGNLRAICSGRNLTFIPRLPSNVEYVTFDHTNLSSRREQMFYNLSFSNTNTLHITGNLVQHLDETAFENLTRLENLFVSYETLLDVNILKRAFLSLQSSCCVLLKLSNNGWNDLPEDIFLPIRLPRRKTIILSGNNLHDIDFNSFTSLQVKKLHLDNNNIVNMKFEPLPKLLHLDLEDNSLRKVPKFCDLDDKSFFPILTFLNLKDNDIGFIGHKAFKCLPKLTTLVLENINTGKLQNNIFSDMPNLNVLRLAKVGRPLKKIDPLAFNSSSLTKLLLKGSHFHFNGNDYDPDKLFYYCPNLEILDLSENLFHFPATHDKLARILKPLKQLQWLSLSSVGLYTLPKYSFTNLKNLHTLNVEDNFITFWNHSDIIFGGLKTLRHLNLRGNLITLIKETSLPQHLLQSLKSLNLEKNPFSCTCEQMWFLNWTRVTDINLGLYPKFYICAYPPNLKGIRLIDYHPTNKLCNPWNPLITIIATLTSVVVLSLIVSIVITRCQANFKNYMYFLRVHQKRRKGYLRLENDMDFEYHAFVIYCDSDRNWVHKELLNNVENIEGMRLCIHHRDFDVGEAITNNFDKYLQKSWKVIVVMSNKFCKSEWCQWEVDIIQGRRREKCKDAVVPIMLENIDSKHMTGKIRMLVDATPYLTYKTGVGAEMFWKALIESLRKPLSHPPISVL